MLFTIISLTLLVAAGALPSGAPNSACQSLQPGHSEIPPQSGPSPYGITAVKTGNTYAVTVKSNDGSAIKGIIMQARSENEEPQGQFEVSSESLHTIDCSASADTVTHSNIDDKSSIEVVWNPNGYNGNVVFTATVAQEFQTYWKGVQSEQISTLRNIQRGKKL